MSASVDEIKSQFPIFRHHPDMVYLDTAATALKPESVIQSVHGYYSEYSANIHRGVYQISERATAEFEAVRGVVSDFIGAKDSNEVIFTRGATEGINLVANTWGERFVKHGDEILITEMEHHANIVPWQMLCDRKGATLRVARINDAGELNLDSFKELLTEKTRLVAVVHASNSLGTVNPVKEICQLAREKMVPVLVDGAQAISNFEVNVQDLGCDFYVFSGHKLFGPTGVGVLWGKMIHLNEMPPWQGGGEMISRVTFEKTTYNSVPHKFEAGTPAIAEVIGLGKAVSFVKSLDREWVSRHEKELLDYATERLTEVSGLRLIGTARKKIALVSFHLDDVHPHDLGTLLDEEGVAVRTGHHCCQPVMARFQVPATVRAAFSIYNTRGDVDRLVAAVHAAREVFA